MPGSGSRWTADDIPDLSGQRALITGGAGGLGLATAQALVAHGADVIIADINRSAGIAVADTLQLRARGNRVEYQFLDLASLAAVKRFTDGLPDSPLDMLFNIAGIYPPARRSTTADGFELKFGLNYLGHFALTARLLPSLLQSDRPRVVTVSSVTQAWASLQLDDLQAEGDYQPNKVYARTKLACLMFALELDHKARQAQCHLQSMAAHPGIARTTLGHERKQQTRKIRDRMEDMAQAVAMRLFGQSPAQGALPLLYAATAEAATSGTYYGPDGLGQFSGYPRQVAVSAQAMDRKLRGQLWRVSEKLTGLTYCLD